MIKFITFGSIPHYSKSLELIEVEARQSGYFDEIEIYNQEHPIFSANERNKKILEFMKHPNNKRGYGFWIWKGVIILDMMKRSHPDDIIIYADAGCSIVFHENAKRIFNNWISDILSHRNHRISLQMEDLPEEVFTKADLFHYLDCNENSYRKSGQLVGGIQLLLNTKDNQEFMELFLEIAMMNNFHFITDEPSIIKNVIDYRDNRHDQSIFSLLYKKYGSSIRKDHWQDPQYPIIACRRRG